MRKLRQRGRGHQAGHARAHNQNVGICRPGWLVRGHWLSFQTGTSAILRLCAVALLLWCDPWNAQRMQHVEDQQECALQDDARAVAVTRAIAPARAQECDPAGHVEYV